MEKLDASSPEDNGIVGRHLKHVKHWLLSHSQYMNGWTILLLASVSMLAAPYHITLSIFGICSFSPGNLAWRRVPLEFFELTTYWVVTLCVASKFQSSPMSAVFVSFVGLSRQYSI